MDEQCKLIPYVRTDWEENESILAHQLKSICYGNGKERNPANSAKLLHQLGLLYKTKNLHKVSLIQSAALINAAIVRDPENIDIKNDLQNLCTEVLLTARAKKKDANLIEAATNVKKKVKKMRQIANLDLCKLNQIPFDLSEDDQVRSEKQKIADIQKIQETISTQYKNIMKNLSKCCCSIMGDPPSKCRFTVVGMGSLARKEITPYSDFEHIIVLEEGIQNRDDYESILEYFRWFSVIFQIIIVNIGETIIPSVGISSLNDFSKPGESWFHDAFTTRGICFDGMMPHACKFPLGRPPTEMKPEKTELIQPVSKMLRYLETEQDLKNGYHLADILTKTCFVYGDIGIYIEFNTGVQRKLLSQRNSTTFLEKLQNDLAKDRVKFNLEKHFADIYDKSSFNMKQVIYRTTTIFISALGKFHGLQAASCFDIISELAKRNLITKRDEHKLKYAVAIACEVRLKIYMKKQRQDDWIRKKVHSSSEESEITEAVGQQSVIEYFATAVMLQKSLPTFNNYERDHKIDLVWSFDDELCRAELCHVFHFYDKCIEYCRFALRSLNNKNNLNSEDAANYTMIMGTTFLELDKPIEACQQFENELAVRKHISHDESTDVSVAKCLLRIGVCKCNMEKYDEGLHQFELAYHVLTNHKNQNVAIANCTFRIGICLSNIGKYAEAMQKFTQTLGVLKIISKDEASDAGIANCLYETGICFSRMGRYEEAMHQFQQELNIRKIVTHDETSDEDIADTMFQMGICLSNMEKYEEALQQFKEELVIEKQTSSDENIAKCRFQIGVCKKNLGEFRDALDEFEDVLKDQKRISNSQATDVGIAKCMFQIATCAKNTGNLDYALEHFGQALHILKLLSADGVTAAVIANCMYETGICMRRMGKYDEAMRRFEQELNMRKSISNSDAKDVADTMYEMGICLRSKGDFSKALQQFEDELIIRKEMSNNQAADFNIANCLNQIGFCLKSMGRYSDALQQFEKALSIQRKISNDKDLKTADEDLANCISQIGICMKHVGRHHEAIQRFEEEISIRKRIPNEEKYVADCLHDIGICLKVIGKYEPAREKFAQALHLRKQISNVEAADEDVGHTLFQLATCNKIVGKYAEALKQFTKVAEIRNAVNGTLCLANCIFQIGICRCKMGQHDKAQQQFKHALNIRKGATSSPQITRLGMSNCLFQIGICLKNAGRLDEAIQQFENAIRLRNSDDNKLAVGNCMFQIGICKKKLGHYQKAMQNFEKTLVLRKQISNTANVNAAIANCMNEIEICHFQIDNNNCHKD